jgi:hypothetical protein
MAALLSGLALAGLREAAAQGDTRTGTEMLPHCRAFLEGPASLSTRRRSKLSGPVSVLVMY